MGKLYLASATFQTPKGEKSYKNRLIHADIVDGSEEEKCLILEDWFRKYGFEPKLRERLIEVSILPTLNWVADEDVKLRPLQAPSAHTLKECFAELKFGRNAGQQKYLQDLIDELDDIGRGTCLTRHDAANLLTEFWQSSSDACPLEATQQEVQENSFRKFVLERVLFDGMAEK